jgi:hypothetical protein
VARGVLGAEPQLPIRALLAAIGTLSFWNGLKRLSPGLPERALVAVVYIGLVGLNLLVLTEGVIGHPARYVGASAR